jgi:phosphatidylglycerophosphate synthase
VVKGTQGVTGPSLPEPAPVHRRGDAVDVAAAAKPRARSEVLVRTLQPTADALVSVLGRAGVHPHAIVLTHGVLGMVAAGLVASGHEGWPLAALLLVIKMLLDNVDGGVARATGQVTRTGRYLDSILDTLANLALFAALALHGPGAWAWPLAALAAAILMLVLSLDYNLEQRYQALRTSAAAEDDTPIGAPLAVYRVVRGLYDAVLAPQDRWIARADETAFRRLAGTPAALAPLDVRLAWSDLFSTITLVNLGLSTQLLVLALCLVLGVPFAYVWFVFASGAYALGVQALRIWRFRRYLRTVS